MANSMQRLASLLRRLLSGNISLSLSQESFATSSIRNSIFLHVGIFREVKISDVHLPTQFDQLSLNRRVTRAAYFRSLNIDRRLDDDFFKFRVYFNGSPARTRTADLVINSQGIAAMHD